MQSPRTATFFFCQAPHTTSLVSHPLHVRGNRYFSTPCQHRITYTRPHPPHPRRNPHHARQPSIFYFAYSTSPHSSHEKNHYETLDLPVTATAAEIKKQFYALSLRHHPDRNRDDPTASQRFSRISAAYNVLGNAQKRASYDRDHGFHHAHARAPGQHPMGSHSSYSANLHHKGGSYAGSRPASGLSKRRGTFHGPPPSFYAQGGYGTTGRTGDGFSAGKAGARAEGSAGAGSGSQGAREGADPEDYTGFIERNPLGHFNARGHFQTQRAEDARRRERLSKARKAARKEESPMGGGEFGIVRFIVVCGILVAAGGMTGLFAWPSSSVDGAKAGKKRKDAVAGS
ncbi:hypothetical protein N7462_009361 [Penicillium macrosclerotiorum]|uniref:uncharacterized protein n=1 Tax=Penicillium macrosclerotiorum TaxID=303699 RepID=UPI002547D735|nr:uncharacterized protein N7462_009361 [Penicillium macrosclerotiorum]KAJ5673922.1 hypothetical protein N7462_009361 [Penicillium macrosclerotiorum]